jgi:2-hydroxychromene-2-carboxylate isomerase
MPTVTWYFDFVSPYAYFALRSFNRLPVGTQLDYQPVLLAGLLNFWGQRGPAEIAPKRLWTYRACIWWAKQNNVPFRMPAAHPFNSLPYLRLAIAADNSAEAVQAIFKQLWTTGVDPADPSVIAQLSQSLRVPEARLADADVKNALRAATDQAVRRGVFGVPTFWIGEQLFWGSDALDFAAAYLLDPAVLATEEMKLANAIPVGASRARSS